MVGHLVHASCSKYLSLVEFSCVVVLCSPLLSHLRQRCICDLVCKRVVGGVRVTVEPDRNATA